MPNKALKLENSNVCMTICLSPPIHLSFRSKVEAWKWILSKKKVDSSLTISQRMNSHPPENLPGIYTTQNNSIKPSDVKHPKMENSISVK